jgi:hypothetical protein
MRNDNKWEFESDGSGSGYIVMPNGQYLGSVAEFLSVDGAKSDQQIIDQIIKVLNRELPNGEPRKRHRPRPRPASRKAA